MSTPSSQTHWIADYIESLSGLLDCLKEAPAYLNMLERISRATVETFGHGGKMLTMGNGGSAAEALHLAEEMVGRYHGERAPQPAVCLNADPTALTCIANDFGYEQVFARQIEALAGPGDLVVVLSTSGNSPNLVAGLMAARARGAHTAGLLGGNGGEAGELCDMPFIVPMTHSGHVQEVHTMAVHILCEAVERASDAARKGAQGAD